MKCHSTGNFSLLVRTRGTAGFTLLETLTVVVVVGVLASLAAPSLAGQIARIKTQAVLNGLTSDIYYARMMAVRGGARTEVRFAWNAQKSCVTNYDIIELAVPERTVKRVGVSSEHRGVCLTMNNQKNQLIFNSRGVPTTVAARSFYASRGAVADSMRLAQVGRIFRFY